MSRCSLCVNLEEDSREKLASCNICGECCDMFEFDYKKSEELLNSVISEGSEILTKYLKKL
ncbi:MAG: hypothetical protein ACRC0G_06090 [Fusobacteriaceae bacterium]